MVIATILSLKGKLLLKEAFCMRNISVLFLGLFILFLSSPSLHAVAYSEYGYSSVYGVVEDGQGFEALELFSGDDEEPYVNQYCNEEQMKWFDEYLNCTQKFMLMKWGRNFTKIGDEYVMYKEGAVSGSLIEDGEEFDFSYRFKESDEYVDKIFDGTVKFPMSELSCWENGWGDGTEVYDFKKSKEKSHALWNKYFKSGRDWEEHADLPALAGAVIGTIYDASDIKRAPVRDYSCGQFVNYCRTGKPSDKDITWIEPERARNWTYQYRADGIDVLFVYHGTGGPIDEAFLIVTPDDCLRYYKGQDIAFKDPYIVQAQ